MHYVIVKDFIYFCCHANKQNVKILGRLEHLGIKWTFLLLALRWVKSDVDLSEKKIALARLRRLDENQKR